MAGVSAGLFMLLGLPILVELVVVIALTSLLHKHILDSETVKELVRRNFEQSGVALTVSAGNPNGVHTPAACW